MQRDITTLNHYTIECSLFNWFFYHFFFRRVSSHNRINWIWDIFFSQSPHSLYSSSVASFIVLQFISFHTFAYITIFYLHHFHSIIWQKVVEISAKEKKEMDVSLIYCNQFTRMTIELSFLFFFSLLFPYLNNGTIHLFE